MSIKSFIKSPVFTGLCRIIVGAVFVFSGLMKIIDPWGTSAKLFEYMTHFGMDWMQPILLPLTIAQCAIEFVLGVMMVFNRGIKLTSLFTMLAMYFFTLLTLYIAVFDPLDECGCFGAAVRISNWATFGKNLLLLPMSIFVWKASKGKQWNWKRPDYIAALSALALTVLVMLYGWYVRTPIDNFGMAVGTDLRTDVICSKCADNKTKLIYRNLETGEKVAFGIYDKEYYDETKWEFVDVETVYKEFTHEMLERDFAVWQGNHNVADKIADYEGITYMIIVKSPSVLTGNCLRGLKRFLESADGNNVMVLGQKTGAGSFDFTKDTVAIGDTMLPLFNISSNLHQMLLRADAGVVAVKDGVIVNKRFCRNAHRALIK